MKAIVGVKRLYKYRKSPKRRRSMKQPGRSVLNRLVSRPFPVSLFSVSSVTEGTPARAVNKGQREVVPARLRHVPPPIPRRDGGVKNPAVPWPPPLNSSNSYFPDAPSVLSCQLQL